MYIQLNKETKRIEAYIEYCTGTPKAKENCELVEIEEIPNNWMYCKYENERFVLDEEYQKIKELEEKKYNIRLQREVECFPFANRGALWYSMLTEEQKEELQAWYQAWLDAPATQKVPTKPSWLK